MASGKPSANWTVLDVLNWTGTYFADNDIDSPRLTAEMLLCHCLGSERLDLYLQYDRPLNRDELARYRSLISRRIAREPVAYIIGSKGFWEYEFAVGPGVLIPRPDTETLVETALKVLAGTEKETGERRVLELGVGSGAVILSLVLSLPDLVGFASDISTAAIRVASGNAIRLGADTRVCFVNGSWFDPFRPGSGFDLIVSNPPYIPTGDIAGLQPEIVGFEPERALDGGGDGLDCVREIIANAPVFLGSGGMLLLEVGAGQREEIERFADRIDGYEAVEFVKDYAGHDRVVKLKKRLP